MSAETAAPVGHRLRVRDAGECERPWEIGLLDPTQWAAQWIEPCEAVGEFARQRPAYWLAGVVELPGQVARATLHATAHGVYEAFVNAERVGDQELTPGFTAYRRRLQVHSFDVTDLLVAGENVIASLLSDGWWRGQNGFARRVDDYGPTTAFLAELIVVLENGEELTFVTDEQWRSKKSHIIRADLIAGEIHDLRQFSPKSISPGGDRSAWEPVAVRDYGFDQLCEPSGPPVMRVTELPAVWTRKIAERSWIVDFGQNSNGWVRLNKLGPEGNIITITYGEALDDAGDVVQVNVAHYRLAVPESRSDPFQVDQVISSGRIGERFEARHSTKGFQFVRVDGLEVVDVEDLVSVVVHTELAQIGSFKCSSEDINRLHLAADWSFRGNACDIPTDCPTRERSGWTGDWQIYIETASYLYDVMAFSRKWLRDLAADQLESGAVTHIVPDPNPNDDRAPTDWKEIQGCSGWGDAAVHVPWQLYRSTGETDVLAEQWPSMTAWLDYARNIAAAKRHPSRIERSAEPLDHEKYLWDTGFHFGEWLEPGVDLERSRSRAFSDDHGAVATAFMYRTAKEMSEIADLIGLSGESLRLRDFANEVRHAWQREFIDENGVVSPRSQANLTRALAFDLVPADILADVASQLVALIREAGTHLGTGFLATPFLLPVLADTGHVDVAYELLFQRTEPSWLLMLDRGATTVWEEWEGIDGRGVARASLNHYSKGAVISFLHRYTAGLQELEPGYQRFSVRPFPGGGLTRASTFHVSPYGRIHVAWTQTTNGFEIDLTVPEGTTARLCLPDNSIEEMMPGHHRREWKI